MKTRRIIIAAMIALSMTACARQLPTGTMEYSTAFERSVPAGQTLPGTDIKYIGKTEQGAEMSIGGQPTLKQTLDSLSWQGVVAPGVAIKYSLRVLTFDSQSLRAGGTAQVTVSNTNPVAVPVTALPQDALAFDGLITYDVPKGKVIPGTTITYLGKTSDGAQIGGIEGYPYRKEADSIVWTGQLTDKVFSNLDMRVIYFSNTSLRVTGTVKLLVTP
jgi:hypothetical protein